MQDRGAAANLQRFDSDTRGFSWRVALRVRRKEKGSFDSARGLRQRRGAKVKEKREREREREQKRERER